MPCYNVTAIMICYVMQIVIAITLQSNMISIKVCYNNIIFLKNV